jgi:hypothetical protein
MTFFLGFVAGVVVCFVVFVVFCLGAAMASK